MAAIQQMLLAGSGAAVIVPFLLDTIAIAPKFAGSVRKLRAAYAGSAIRVRRSSDNTETDIGFDVNGHLDTATLLTFVGAGNGFVTKVYDQSVAAGSPMAQTTAGSQPAIVLAGVLQVQGGSISRPAWFHNATYFTLAGPQAQPMITSTVLRFNGSVATNATLYSDNALSSLFMSSNGVLAHYAGTTASFKSGISVGDVAVVTELKSGASSKGRYNQVEVSTNPGTNSINTHSLGTTITGTLAQGCYCGEHLIFAVTATSPQMLAMEQNQKAYFGTP